MLILITSTGGYSSLVFRGALDKSVVRKYFQIFFITLLIIVIVYT